MDRIYIALREIQSGTKSAKQLFHKLEKVLNINPPNFEIFIDDLASEVYVSFLGGNDKPNYGDIILTDKGRDYIKHNKSLAGNPSEFIGPCNVHGEMKCKEYFITDINDLCRTCFLRKKIESVRSNLIRKVETLKSINTKEYVIKHLKKEIKADNKIIAKMINIESQGWVEFRENRVGIVLSYKDCIQYQNEQLQLIENGQKNNKSTNEKIISNTRDIYFLSKSFRIGGKEVNGVFQINIANGPNEYIAKAKNKDAKEAYTNWYWGNYNTEELRLEKNTDIINVKRTEALNKLALLLNNISLFELSIPIEKIELLALKNEFDKIETYSEKLKWWGEKGFYKLCYHSIMLTDFEEENAKPENHLTIYPDTYEEIRLFNEFSFNENLKSKEWGGDLDYLINTYWERIKNDANAIEYTKREIDRYHRAYTEAKKFNKDHCNDYAGSALYKFFAVGFDASTEGKIKDLFRNKLLVTKMADVAQGYTAEKYIRFLDKQLKELEQGNGQIIPKIQIGTALPLSMESAITNTDKLQTELKKYGFYTLEKVTSLSNQTTQKAIRLLVINGLPYKIAMFEYLGFITHLEEEHFKTKAELYKGIAGILNIDKRSVKGNILVLNDISNENRVRYTAHLHKETVKKDYLKIK